MYYNNYNYNNSDICIFIYIYQIISYVFLKPSSNNQIPNSRILVVPSPEVFPPN